MVLGYLVRGPLGGMAWHHLQYLLGLRALGHDVWFVEDSDDDPSCYRPDTDETTTDPSYGLAFAAWTLERLGFGRRWSYFDAHAGRWRGPGADGAVALCTSADVILDLSGVTPARPWLLEAPTRVLVDTDPAVTQIRHLTDPAARERAATHTHFFTFAENVGRSGCTVPDDGFPWMPTRQPVVLDQWPVTPGDPARPLTTVMQWQAHPPLDHGGRRLGSKRETFLSGYLDLPARVSTRLELAVGSPSAPRDLLRRNGWSVLDPRGPSRDPWTFQEYVRHSAGEWSVASEAYVATCSGWFSERSTSYLASGRPVVVQDTGFSKWLPSGLGVLPFRTPDEAAAGIADVLGRYGAHCRAAREVAAESFDASRVLANLLRVC